MACSQADLRGKPLNMAIDRTGAAVDVACRDRLLLKAGQYFSP